MQYGEVGTPRTDFLRALPGHGACDLRDVSEIVGDPCGEELSQGDGTELRMGADLVECGGVEVEFAQRCHVLGAEPGELGQQCLECSTPATLNSIVSRPGRLVG